MFCPLYKINRKFIEEYAALIITILVQFSCSKQRRSPSSIFIKPYCAHAHQLISTIIHCNMLCYGKHKYIYRYFLSAAVFERPKFVSPTIIWLLPWITINLRIYDGLIFSNFVRIFRFCSIVVAEHSSGRGSHFPTQTCWSILTQNINKIVDKMCAIYCLVRWI